MTAKVVGVPPSATIKEAAALMKKNCVGSVLVGDGDNPVGIVTETDIVQKAVAGDRSPYTTKLEEIMSYPLIMVEAGQTGLEAAETMNDNGVRHLAVTENERVIGILSMRDLLRPFTDSQES